MATSDDQLTRYVLVSQHNWKTHMILPDGRRTCSLGYRPPPSMDAAPTWPGTRLVTAPVDDPPPLWFGHGTYQDIGGELVLVAADWDTSG